MNIINKRYLLVEENGFDDYSIRTFHTLEEAKITVENYEYKFTIIDLQNENIIWQGKEIK